MPGDEFLLRVCGDRADLRFEMLGERFAPRGTLLDIGAFAAADPDLPAQFDSRAVAGFAVVPECFAVEIERGVRLGVAFEHELVGGRFARLRILRRCDGRFGRFGRVLAHFEQRVGVERVADEGLQLEVGQRQQLDRLLELGRHDQRLGLPQVEARAEGHLKRPSGLRSARPCAWHGRTPPRCGKQRLAGHRTS